MSFPHRYFADDIAKVGVYGVVRRFDKLNRLRARIPIRWQQHFLDQYFAQLAGMSMENIGTVVHRFERIGGGNIHTAEAIGLKARFNHKGHQFSRFLRVRE